MIHTSGKALIKHSQTGRIYEIDSEEIDFQSIGITDERNMGHEETYSAVFEHDQLGILEWSLLEYPIGVENYRDTNVGPHQLIQDIDFWRVDDHISDEDAQSTIDYLVDWFHENYEDPALNLPYIKKEGRYQWDYEGPYNAHEVLNENFLEESEEIRDAAVRKIEARGLTEWTFAPTPAHYGEGYCEPHESEDWQNDFAELSLLISKLPPKQTYPEFNFGVDGLLHLDSPSDIQNVNREDELFKSLKVTQNNLLKSLFGTNAHESLLKAARQYNQEFSCGQISISRLYACGVVLENTASVVKRNVENQEIPTLLPDVESNLNSTLELHHTYIMLHDEGKNLVKAAYEYRCSYSETEKLKVAAKQLENAVVNTPKLFGKDVMEHISNIVVEIDRKPCSERSNQVAINPLKNLFFSMLRTLKNVGILSLGTIGLIASASAPGQAVINFGVDRVNAVWYFLSKCIESFKVIFKLIPSNASSITKILDLVERLMS